VIKAVVFDAVRPEPDHRIGALSDLPGLVATI
jgi:hypothetical protein